MRLFTTPNTTGKRAKGPGQKYHLMLEPVLLQGIGTGCNKSWYFWLAPSASKTRHGTNWCQYTNKGTG